MKHGLKNLLLLLTYLIKVYRCVEELKPLPCKGCALQPGIVSK